MDVTLSGEEKSVYRSVDWTAGSTGESESVGWPDLNLHLTPRCYFTSDGPLMTWMMKITLLIAILG